MRVTMAVWVRVSQRKKKRRKKIERKDRQWSPLMRWVSKWYKQLLYKQLNQRWSLWQWVGGQKDYEDQPPVLSSMSNVDFETWYPVKLFIQLVLFWRMNQFWKKSYLVHSWSILVTLKIKEMWKWIQKIEDSESFEIH